MLRSATKFLHHRFARSDRRWYPLLAVYYLTYRCSFRCPYCSDGAQNPYYTLRSPVLDAGRVIDVLRAMRRHSEFAVMTGGEPSEHPEFAEVLRRLPELDFRGLILTTNGHDIERDVPSIVRNVTELVISVDTLDHNRADGWYGVGQGALGQILDNLDRARRAPGRRCEIVVSSVVGPENIPDLYGVYEYTRKRGFRFAACPQLVGVKAHPALTADPEYSRFFEFLIEEKKKGGNVHGTIPYLEHMRDLKKFGCRPFTMLVVSPNGDVFYPCLEIGKFAGNLLEEGDLHALRSKGKSLFGPQPVCDNRCHSACALGFSLLLAEPASVFLEGYLTVKGHVLRRIRGEG